MAKQVKLAAQPRTETGRSAVKKIKEQGSIPAVIYAHNEAPAALRVAERDIDAILAHAVGENVLVDLEIAGGARRMAMIQEVQHHPVTQAIMHVDFVGVSANEALEATVPVEASGDADGVKNGGGLLEQLTRSIRISCLPKDLPDVISVDVTALKIGDSLHVRDIRLPAGVTALEPDHTVFLVAAPTVAAEPEPAAAAAAEAAPAQPEMIKEKKVEEKK